MTPQRYTGTKDPKEFPRPAYRADESWRCPVCGASPGYLVNKDPILEESVYCSDCGFPFSLSVRKFPKGKKAMPVPALNALWIKAWRIVYRQYQCDATITRRIIAATKDPMIIIEAEEKLLKQAKEGEPCSGHSTVFPK